MSTKETISKIVKALLLGHHHAVLGKPLTDDIARALPIRTITGIQPRAGRVVAVVITEKRSGKICSPREMYELAGLMLGWLSIFRSAYFNTETELHYLDVLDGIAFHRVMVGAAAGEEICLGLEHLVLLPETFSVELTQRFTTEARPRAIEQALIEWDKNAARLGLATLLPRERYEEILKEVFALYDTRYGHLLARPVKAAA